MLRDSSVQERDRRIRALAITHVNALALRSGGVLAWSDIERGFHTPFGHVHLASRARGIFAPAGDLLVGALSVKTNVPRRGRRRWYDDSFDAGARQFDYRYQGNDPGSRDNRLVRACFERQLPLIYFIGIAPAVYVPEVCLVDDDVPEALTFRLAPIDPANIGTNPVLSGAATIRTERAYAFRLARTRLHQARFREAVMQAYGTRCAVCHLGHSRLLDAAHIIPDGEPDGDPVIPNGLSLCKLHHAAFDQDLIAIRPDDYRVLVAPSVRDEQDGPMLEHGLKGMHGRRLELPRRPADRPDPSRLERRYAAVDWR